MSCCHRRCCCRPKVDCCCRPRMPICCAPPRISRTVLFVLFLILALRNVRLGSNQNVNVINVNGEGPEDIEDIEDVCDRGCSTKRNCCC